MSRFWDFSSKRGANFRDNPFPDVRSIPRQRDNAERQPRPVAPHYYSEMSRKMAEQFHKSLEGAMSTENALKTLQSQLQRIILSNAANKLGLKQKTPS